MSLDVTLYGPERTEPCRCRDCEHVHERATRDVFYDANITHNLNKMASAAGIYEALWCPDEHGLTTAAQLVPLLRVGLAKLRADPARYRKLNPANKWGSYEGLCRMVEAYLAACEANPTATVSVRR